MFVRVVAVLMLTLGINLVAAAQPGREEGIVLSSIAVLDETMAIPLGKIPDGLRDKAQGVAIFPNVIKGGFIIGARHGSGVLLVRDSALGAWHAPVFATITGGNLGFQAGLQATDLVLIFTTRQSVQRILNGKFTIGVDAAAAAGPAGRQAAAATDARLAAEIYSYSRSRGLFLGVSLDGSVLRIDSFANGAYYHNAPGGQTIIPASAATLTQNVTSYTSGARVPTSAPTPTTTTTNVQPSMAISSMSEADHLRDQLRHVSPELYELLSPDWAAYLKLPAAVFTGQGHPSLPDLERAVARFNEVASNAAYRELQQTPQFQSTYGLLRHYQSSLLSQAKQVLQLPSPPQTTFPPGPTEPPVVVP